MKASSEQIFRNGILEDPKLLYLEEFISPPVYDQLLDEIWNAIIVGEADLYDKIMEKISDDERENIRRT